MLKLNMIGNTKKNGAGHIVQLLAGLARQVLARDSKFGAMLTVPAF
jgi:hypothetical protein